MRYNGLPSIKLPQESILSPPLCFNICSADLFHYLIIEVTILQYADDFCVYIHTSQPSTEMCRTRLDRAVSDLSSVFENCGITLSLSTLQLWYLHTYKVRSTSTT